MIDGDRIRWYFDGEEGGGQESTCHKPLKILGFLITVTQKNKFLSHLPKEYANHVTYCSTEKIFNKRNI